MNIIVIRGGENAGKTTTAKMTFDSLSKEAESIYLFDHYNNQIKTLHYNQNGEVYDFKAVLKVKDKIIVIITAGDEPWRLMINIEFLIDFIKKTFQVIIDVLICCGRSHNRKGSVIMRLKDKYRDSFFEEVWVYRVDEKEKEKEKNKEAALKKILKLL